MRARTLAAAAALALGSTAWGAGSARAELRLDTVNTIACAHEGGICRMPHPTNVYFGVPGKTNGRPFPNGGSVPCNVQTFGDPAPGQAKACWYAPRITDGGSRARSDDRPRDDDRPRYDRRSGYDDRPRYEDRPRYDDRPRDEDRDYDRPRRSSNDDYAPRRRYRSDPDDE